MSEKWYKIGEYDALRAFKSKRKTRTVTLTVFNYGNFNGSPQGTYTPGKVSLALRYIAEDVVLGEGPMQLQRDETASVLMELLPSATFDDRDGVDYRFYIQIEYNPPENGKREINLKWWRTPSGFDSIVVDNNIRDLEHDIYDVIQEVIKDHVQEVVEDKWRRSQQ